MGYEPKFDGFRAMAFVDGEDVMLQSRGAKPLGRYFPELSFPAGRYVIDGEIMIDGGPTASRTSAPCSSASIPRRHGSRCWPSRRPAHYVAFDVLAPTTRACSRCPSPSAARALEALDRAIGIGLTPLTLDPAETEPWLAHGEGVVAKDRRAPYRPGKREGWSRSSACGRSTPSSSATGPARRQGRSAR